MRKALVGIAAALMLTTLIITIVPAFASYPLTFTTSDSSAELLVNPTTHEFLLFGQTGLLCAGVGAVVVKGVLVIAGKCQIGAATFLSAGGKALTGPIKLVLVTVSKPSTKPMLFTLWPPT
jgi:hypothetical protein